MIAHTEISSLIGSRICHDLISPIGAIGNGLELMMLAGIEETPELALIRDSIASATARIRFYRIAYGSAPDGQQISNSEIKDIIGAYSQTSRADITWADHSNPSRPIARLLFLLVQCLELALPFSGTIQVEPSKSGWTLIGTGPKQRMETRMWSHLTDGVHIQDLQPSDLQFVLAKSAAQVENLQLTAEQTNTGITVRAVASGPNSPVP